MPRVLLVDKRMFCEKHQVFFKEFKDSANMPFWICLFCDNEEEVRELKKERGN